MSEQRFIVPPGVTPGDSNQPQTPQVPKNPANKKLGAWIKNNKVLTGASSLLALVVLVFGLTVFTGTQVSILGLKLNPLFNRANLSACDVTLQTKDLTSVWDTYFLTEQDCVDTGIGGGGGGTPTTPTTPVTSSNTVLDSPIVEFQVGDAHATSPSLPSQCSSNLSGWSTGGITVQPTTGDTIDCMKVRITNPSPNYSKDFRICYQIEGSTTVCTPWASQGGSGPVINSNGGFTNFHGWVETQDLPSGKLLQNVQVGNQLFYGNEGGACGASSGVAWASNSTPESSWAYGAQQDNDPGCAQVHIQASLVDYSSVFPLSIDGSFSTGVVSQSYNQTLSLGGNPQVPCTWSIVSINPNISGAILNASSDTKSATFSATPNAAGTYQVNIQSVCQNGQTITKAFDWEVGAAPLATLDIVGSMPNGITTSSYSYGFTSTGAVSPLTWTLVSVSPSANGATIDPKSGVFTASPIVATTYQVTVKASQADGATVTKTFSWLVNAGIENPPLPPVNPQVGTITGAMPNGTTGQAYSYTYTTSGFAAPATWTLVSVTPAISGATVSSITGAFTATPNTAGTYQVNVKVTGSDGGTATKTFDWTVNNPTQNNSGAINGSMQIGTINQPYSYTFTSTGLTSPMTWSIVSISPNISGATINSSTGAFTATPTAVGTYKVTIKATGADGASVTKDFDLIVADQNPVQNANTCLDPTTLNKLTAIYRFWSPAYGDHLYTTNANEKPAGYRFEGVAGYVYNTQVPNTKPIYRSAQKQIGSHYYTQTNEDPTKYGYTDEGILGYAYESSVAGSSPWFRLHKGGETSDYVHTMSAEEKTAVMELGYADEGTVAYICGNTNPTELQPMFRLWSLNDTDHFYTTNFAERDSLLSKGFISEGIAGYIYGVRKSGSFPLYRSYNSNTRDHFYATSEAEATPAGYKLEGLMGYIASTNTTSTTPWYRLYSSKITDHFYTVSPEEAGSAIRSGYVPEGVTGYLYLTQQ